MGMPNPEKLAENITHDVQVLSHRCVGPSDASWQDVAKTLACNLQVLSGLLTDTDARRYSAGIDAVQHLADCFDGETIDCSWPNR